MPVSGVRDEEACRDTQSMIRATAFAILGGVIYGILLLKFGFYNRYGTLWIDDIAGFFVTFVFPLPWMFVGTFLLPTKRVIRPLEMNVVAFSILSVFRVAYPIAENRAPDLGSILFNPIVMFIALMGQQWTLTKLTGLGGGPDQVVQKSYLVKSDPGAVKAVLGGRDVLYLLGLENPTSIDRFTVWRTPKNSSIQMFMFLSRSSETGSVLQMIHFEQGVYAIMKSHEAEINAKNDARIVTDTRGKRNTSRTLGSTNVKEGSSNDCGPESHEGSIRANRSIASRHIICIANYRIAIGCLLVVVSLGENRIF